MAGKCEEHSGHEARLISLEQNKEAMWKQIDGMKSWVIAGMTSMIIQLVMFIGGLILMYIKT